MLLAPEYFFALAIVVQFSQLESAPGVNCQSDNGQNTFAAIPGTLQDSFGIPPAQPAVSQEVPRGNALVVNQGQTQTLPPDVQRQIDALANFPSDIMNYLNSVLPKNMLNGTFTIAQPVQQLPVLVETTTLIPVLANQVPQAEISIPENQQSFQQIVPQRTMVSSFANAQQQNTVVNPENTNGYSIVSMPATGPLPIMRLPIIRLTPQGLVDQNGIEQSGVESFAQQGAFPAVQPMGMDHNMPQMTGPLGIQNEAVPQVQQMGVAQQTNFVNQPMAQHQTTQLVQQPVGIKMQPVQPVAVQPGPMQQMSVQPGPMQQMGMAQQTTHLVAQPMPVQPAPPMVLPMQQVPMQPMPVPMQQMPVPMQPMPIAQQNTQFMGQPMLVAPAQPMAMQQTTVLDTSDAFYNPLLPVAGPQPHPAVFQPVGQNYVTNEAYQCGAFCARRSRVCRAPCTPNPMKHRCVTCYGTLWNDCRGCFPLSSMSINDPNLPPSMPIG